MQNLVCGRISQEAPNDTSMSNQERANVKRKRGYPLKSKGTKQHTSDLGISLSTGQQGHIFCNSVAFRFCMVLGYGASKAFSIYVYRHDNSAKLLP